MPHIGSILIVEPELPIVDLLIELLTDEGYIAYTMPDGVDMLVAIARHQPALILLDLGHPGLPGAELLEALRGAGLATLPIVFMATEPLDATPLLVPGLVECLAKPFDFGKLLVCVEHYVPLAQAVKPAPYYAL